MFKGLSYTLFSFVVNKAGFFLISIISANLMLEEDFAVYSVFFTIMLAFNGTFSQGNYTVANRYFSDTKLRTSLLFIGILIAILSSLICFTYLNVIYMNVFSVNENLIISTIVFFTAIYYLLNGCGYSIDKVDAVAKSNLISFVILLLSTFLINDIGYLAVLFGYLTSVIVSTIYLTIRLVSKHDFDFSNVRYEKLRRIFNKVLLPFLISSLAFVPLLSHLGASLIEGTQGHYDVSIFNVSNQVRMVISFIPLVLTAYFLSKIVGNKLSFKSDWTFTLYLTSIVTSFLILMCPLVLLSFNLDANEDSILCILFMILSSLVVSIKSSIGRQILAKEQGWLSIWSNMLFAVLFYVMTYEVDSATSLARCFFLSQLIHFVIFIPIFNKRELFSFSFLFNFDFLSCSLLVLFTSLYVVFDVNILLVIFSFIFCLTSMLVCFKNEVDLS